MTKRTWRVRLPDGASPPYGVYVNGVPQREGVDYELRGRELHFPRPLEKEGRIGLGRWAAMFFGLFGTYRKNDSVDVRYRLGDSERVAVGLDIVPPDP